MQDNAGPGTEGGKVAFYGLDIPHAAGLSGAGARAPSGGNPSRLRIGSGSVIGESGWRARFGAYDAGGRQ